MRRRGNKSSKVPNVKLRPADKGAYARPIVESCWAQDTQVDSDDTAAFDLCPRPMKGMSICATGVTDKPTLFKQAVELGATCTPAFTDRVTHLVAVDHGGAKYMCALERKIPIVKPSWIMENYQIWLKGDDVDMAQSAERHRLPIFSGVVVCPSGITDITRRTQISKILRKHDGIYLKDLERPVRVTHLLCSGDEETEKMRYAEKFNAKGEAKIHLIWEEWFWDSLDFGGRFDEAKYQVRRPRPERKTLVEARNTSLPPSSTVPSQHDEAPSPSLPNNNNNNNNNADDQEDEPAFVNVLPDVTLQLWGGLLERRGYQITDGEVILSPSKIGGPNSPKKTILPDPASPVRQQFGTARSILSNCRRANSFAPAAPLMDPGSSRQLPFRRTSTAAAVFSGRAQPGAPSAGGDPAMAGQSSKHGEAFSAGVANASGSGSASLPPQIFAGKRVRALGEAKGAVVRNAVEQLGGYISTVEDEEVDFIIVRLVSGSKIYRMEEDEYLRRKYRTDCWLEQCIYEERICAPDEQVSFVPLDIQLPVAGAEDIIISISGFEQSEAHGLKRLFRALGIALATTFTRHSTHLICPSGTGLKFEKAREWDIPVIDVQWLAAMASSGAIPQVHEFLVNGSFVPEIYDDLRMQVDRKDVKGKGKAIDNAPIADTKNAMDVEDDSRIHDITNNEALAAAPRHTPAIEPHLKNPKSLEREPTVIIPNPPEPEKFIFGMPNHTLGGSSYIPHPSSIATPSRSLLGTPAFADPSRQGSVVSLLDADGSATFDFGPSLARRRAATAGLDDVRVPSSTSPSPMKAPLQRSTSRSSLSPMKVDHEATKALQESITSLLGKRPSPEGDEAGALTGVGPAHRNGKRARPQRSKPQSRQPSDAQLAARVAESSKSARMARKPDPGLPAGYNDGAINPFDSSYADDLSPQEESMRVMYEDPGQRDEKKRIMNLLRGTSGEEDAATPSVNGSRDFDKKARRSTRIAGF
ncbi:hypothetical protein HYPSUDRAFT_214141 [Hypholoma sublateritium FD-334 SS-4]|uniref:BRCT domain-containing protein n=1 Tax=Hypholoma sublateritium (strain FD-334 SS-4) TaxID=945553 RepID=A0A0D2LCS9_HYPSF|nr:hypothetical protein HYPSUDRAFT_214141 [Hypholoma sublateritium FD-334 SS-4]